jgi:hypothetical protein
MERRSQYDVFTELFETKLKTASDYTDAFRKAEEEFESKYHFSPYSSYNSYRNVRTRRIRRRIF